LDKLIFDHCIRDLRRKSSSKDLAQKLSKKPSSGKEDVGIQRARIRLIEACNKAKKALGIAKVANVEVEALNPDNAGEDFFSSISRDIFDESIKKSGKLDALKEIIEEALEESGNIEEKDLDSVLIIGGGSNVPIVNKYVFPNTSRKDLVKNCDESVALGCAKQACLLLEKGDTYGNLDKCPANFEEANGDEEEESNGDLSRSVKVLDKNVGVLIDSKTAHTILPKGIAVPARQSVAVNVGEDTENKSIGAIIVSYDDNKDKSTNFTTLGKVSFTIEESTTKGDKLYLSADKDGRITAKFGEKEIKLQLRTSCIKINVYTICISSDCE